MTDPARTSNVESNSLVARLRSAWARIDPTDPEHDPVGQANASVLLAEAALALDDLQHEHHRLVIGAVPTHRCKVCGALWTRWTDSWSLFSRRCGKCCDNVAMGEQIDALPRLAPETAPPALWVFKVNNSHECYSRVRPPSDAIDEGSLIPLYAHPPAPETAAARKDVWADASNAYDRWHAGRPEPESEKGRSWKAGYVSALRDAERPAATTEAKFPQRDVPDETMDRRKP